MFCMLHAGKTSKPLLMETNKGQNIFNITWVQFSANTENALIISISICLHNVIMSFIRVMLFMV